MKSKQSAFVRRNRRNQLKPLLGFAGGVAGAVLARMLGFPDWVSVAIYVLSFLGAIAYFAVMTLGEENCPNCDHYVYHLDFWMSRVICRHCGANLSEDAGTDEPGKS